MPKRNLTSIIIMYLLIGFLFLYHSFKLYNIYLGDDHMNSDTFLNSSTIYISAGTIVVMQSTLRILILISLVLIVRTKKAGISGMWLGIGLLVISQFWLVEASNDSFVRSTFSGLKPLKGFILPTIISILYIILQKKIDHGYNK